MCLPAYHAYMKSRELGICMLTNTVLTDTHSTTKCVHSKLAFCTVTHPSGKRHSEDEWRMGLSFELIVRRQGVQV